MEGSPASPYVRPPIALLIGPNLSEFYVPRDFLQNSDRIATSLSSAIHLPDMDEGTSHGVVHYLYTGATQKTLGDEEASPAAGIANSFKQLVHIAAKQYVLRGLEKQAMEEIDRFGADMDIFDIIQVIKDDFTTLVGDSLWVKNYLVAKAKAAFEEDHTIFAEKDIFHGIENVALAKLLAKCVVELYSSKVSSLLNVGSSLAEESAAEECFAATLPEEPVVEEYITKDCIKDSPAEQYRAQGDCTEKPNDFNFEIFNTVPAAPVPLAEENPPLSEPEPEPQKVDEEDPWSFSFGKVSSKKKKKKDIAMFEELVIQPEPELELAIEVEPSDWDFAPTGKKKSKKGKEETCEEVKEVLQFDAPQPPHPKPPPPELVSEPQQDDDSWFWPPKAMKKKKGKKKSVEIAPPAPEFAISEPEPEPEPVIDSTAGVQNVSSVDEPKMEEEQNPRQDKPVEGQDDICPFRAKHLLEGDVWKSCKQCRAMLRQIAIKLSHSAGVDEDGYEVVDRILMK